MMIGVRAKLIGLLTFVALLPLAVALATITIGGQSMRSESFGQAIRTMAASKAAVLGLSLRKDIEKLREGLLHDQRIISALTGDIRALTRSELDDLDARWGRMGLDEAPMPSILNNPAAAHLKHLQREDDRMAELFLTDRFGQLVAATERTSDYYQGDEDWWQQTFNAGAGRIYIPPVSYDESSGVWGVDLCLPVRHKGAVIGIVKIVIDASRWIGSDGGAIGDVTADLMLVRDDDGAIIHSGGLDPMTAIPGRWHGDITSRTTSGWRITDDGWIQGFAPVVLPDHIGTDRLIAPEWSVVYTVRRSKAMAAVYRLSLIVLALGAVIIGSLFLVGLFLVERSIVRRIRRLARATRNVAQGDLSHRIDVGRGDWRILGRDEIDALSDDFNRMMERVQHSHAELEAGNEMKTNFIRIAGHELRTPVSFILATVKLLRDSTDPDRLLHALQSMGAKAKRLDEIIHAMFKLMPQQQYSERLDYDDVNLTELLEEIYLDCFPFVQGRDQRLLVTGAENVPVFRADREKLRDVIENLVMNAIKFTPDGGTITITAGMELGAHVSLSVQDQGPGIAKQEQERIFEPFYSGGDVLQHSSGSAGFQKRGMGLGLAIVRHFTQMHGGTVRLSSSPDGCRFTILIPSEPPPQSAKR